MALIFFKQSSNIVFVVYLFRVSSNCELLEWLVFTWSERNTLCSEELMHDIESHVTESLGIQHLKGIQESLCSGWFELIRHQHLKHKWLEFLILNEITRLIILQLTDNVVTNLCLTRELQQILHDVTDFSIFHKRSNARSLIFNFTFYLLFPCW